MHACYSGNLKRRRHEFEKKVEQVGGKIGRDRNDT